MKIKYIFLLFFIYFSNFSFTQSPCGGGTNKEYSKLKIKKVIEFHYSYSGWVPCDSTPKRMLEFNMKGQMIKETFIKSKNYYSYTYNDEGFLISIDTNGIFGYGQGTFEEDTTFEEIKENWIHLNGEKKILDRYSKKDNDSIYRKTIFVYNENGKIKTEINNYSTDSKVFKLSYSINYIYDKNGLILKIIWKDQDNIDYAIDEFKYETF